MWLQCWVLSCTSSLGIWCGEITWLFVQPIIIILVNYMQLHNPFTKVCENLILAHYCLTTFPLCCDSNVAWQPIRLHLLHVITRLSLRGVKQVWWHWGLCVFVWIWETVDVIFSPACKTCQQITLVAAWVVSCGMACSCHMDWCFSLAPAWRSHVKRCQQLVICSASLFLRHFFNL